MITELLYVFVLPLWRFLQLQNFQTLQTLQCVCVWSLWQSINIKGYFFWEKLWPSIQCFCVFMKVNNESPKYPFWRPQRWSVMRRKFPPKNLCKDMKCADKKELIISAGNVFRDGSGTLQRRTICHRHLEVEGAAFKTRL